jgi:hypothetical protein
MPTAKPRPPVWLIVLYVLSLLTILAWPFIALMSAFAFDAPGSAEDPAVWTGVIAVLSYPVLPVIGVLGSFLFYRGGRRVPAYVLAGLGAIPLALFVLVFIAMVIGNIAFLAGRKF